MKAIREFRSHDPQTQNSQGRNPKAMTARTGASSAHPSRASDEPDAIDALVAGSTQTLALPIDPAWHGGGTSTCNLLFTHAALVDEFPLPDEIRAGAGVPCLKRPPPISPGRPPPILPPRLSAAPARRTSSRRRWRASAPRDPLLNSFTAVTEQRALCACPGARRRPRPRRTARPARRRAVRGEKPVRHRRHCRRSPARKSIAMRRRRPATPR